MAAAVEYDETNGAAPGTVTHAIATAQYGALDAVHLAVGAGPIPPGTNSYEKWHRWHLVSLLGSLRVEKFRLFCSASPIAGDVHAFNGHATQVSYESANHRQTVYATPATTATRTPEIVPAADPGVANIGVGGLLSGALTTEGDLSDYVVSQIRVAGATVAGKMFTLVFAYEEIA